MRITNSIFTATFLFIVSLPFWGYSQQTINGAITHDGMQREYILYVPENYTGNLSVPLIFNFHGYGSNANEQMWYGDFRSISDTAGFIIVHPQGTLLNGITHWNVGGWTIGSTADDVGFTEALLDSISVMYNIDSTRIFSTGMSNGGFMSFLLACQLSEKIAAIASVTGSMTPETYNNSNPQHPTPVMQIHGTSDGTVPYTGSSWTKPIETVLQYWVEYNSCNPLSEITLLPDIDPNDGSTVEHYVFSGGNSGVNVEHFKVTGGDHAWPGSAINLPGTNYDIDASVEIWKFFSRYNINGLMIPTAVKQLNEKNFQIKIYPNPATSQITIEGDFPEGTEYEILSSFGQRISVGLLNSNVQQIDLSDLTPNVYFIKIGEETHKILILK